MNKIFVYVIFIFFLPGCATLTTTQVKSVNQFAEASKQFSAYPSKILSELSEVRRQSGIYFVSGSSDPRNILPGLDKVYKDFIDDNSASRKVNITFKIIDKYAQSLLLLSSDKHAANLEEQANTFGIDIDSLITVYNGLSGSAPLPTGIGGAVKKLVVLAGTQYIRKVQAEEIKKFVPRADALIEEMTKNLIDFLQNSKLNVLILGVEGKLTSDFTEYLGKNASQTIPLSSYEQYLDLKKKIDEIKALRVQTIEATQELREAHKALLTAIETKKTLKEQVKEIKELFEQVKDIHTTILEIDKPQNLQ